MMYDMHLSMVGHKIHSPDEAYGVIDLINLPVAAATVNGVENP